MGKYIRHIIKSNKIIGSGAKRIVYDLGNNTVLKVAKSKKGIRNNEMEVAIYKSSPYPIKKHLGQIIKYGDTWVIMKKYSRRFPKSKKYRSIFMRMQTRFKKYGIIPDDLVSRRDGKPNLKNLRLNQNKDIIVIDYGDFRRK